MAESRANVVSSFTIIKGSLLDETNAAFAAWDFTRTKTQNLQRIKADNVVAARSVNWLRDVCLVLNRRFDPDGRDRPLVFLIHAGIDRETWKPLLLWHMTRDEFLVRDFLLQWLYPRFLQGIYQLRTDDLLPYLQTLHTRKDIECSEEWSDSTTRGVASSLLRMAADFGLLNGSIIRTFASYHLSDDSFLYLLHAMAAQGWNARRIIDSEDWHMYLMDSDDVHRELLRLHQYRRLRYEVAGSLAQLDLPCRSLAAFAREMAR